MNYSYGIYLVRRPKRVGFGLHYGVLSVGVLSPFLEEVVDFGPDGFRRQSLDVWAGSSKHEVVAECPAHEIQLALARLRAAVDEDRGYRLWKNNCEHVASWVALGKRRSAQVEGFADFLVVAVTGAAIVGAAVLIARAA